MNCSNEGRVVIQALIAARRVANLASAEGASIVRSRRPMTSHMGAVLADAVLQAGVSYSAVVLPRILRILQQFQDRDRVSALAEVVSQERTSAFLNWEHSEKICRFNSLVSFLHVRHVETTEHLRERLLDSLFGLELQSLRGVGPKTVDYLACLVGIDSIAVDRHVRAFARMAGVEETDYGFLRNVFCYAADLLSMPRRDFDAWIWRNQSSSAATQFNLAL
jgi:hypothetical protein